MAKPSTLIRIASRWDEMEAYLDGLPFKQAEQKWIAQELVHAGGFAFNVQNLANHQLVKQYVAAMKAADGLEEDPAPVKGKPDYSWKEDQQTAEVTFVAEKQRIVTFDDAVKASGADMEVWEAERWTFNKWEMGFKQHINETIRKVLDVKHKDTNVTSGTQDLIQVRIWFKRRKAPAFDYLKVREEQIAEMQAYAPVYRTIKRKPLTDGYLLVLDPADIHFGKLASLIETGEVYNLDIARTRVVEGVTGILQKAQGFPIERILLVLGNDMLHTDNAANTTQAGTRQDVAGMWHEGFQVAKHTIVEIIESLLLISDVDVILNLSNHDYVMGYGLFDSIASWFSKCKNVTFDGRPIHRKYYQWHHNLIGTTHGDGAKQTDLVYLMSHEAPQEWAATKHRYWYTHHLHHKEGLKYRPSKDYIGVTIETVRTPSATDSWHMKKGYTGVPKAVEGFVHSKEHGQVARLTHIFN